MFIRPLNEERLRLNSGRHEQRGTGGCYPTPPIFKRLKEASGQPKVGMVVPTGFEPVFWFDCDFALFCCMVGRLYSTCSQVGLKHALGANEWIAAHVLKQ